MLPLSHNDPRVIGRYRLIASLGQGGMGHVYLAIDPNGQRVAVKRVLPQLSGDPGFRQRFVMEVEAARQVAGPYTAAVVDADATSAEPWSATEFVAGPTLSEVIERQGALNERFVRTLGTRLAAALMTVHDAGLLHRDLKPSNVLLASDGVKLLDFGISRAMDYSTSVALTHTGGAVGSPGYMSPEQAQSSTLTSKSDVFSLGILLATAAAGRTPFDASSIPQLLYQVVHTEPDLDDIPESIRVPIARCLAKDPEERPSLAELSALLEASGDTASEHLPIVDDYVAEQESRIAAFRPALPSTMVDRGPTMVMEPPKSGRKKIIVASAAVVVLLTVAISVMFTVAETDMSSLEMPADTCDLMDLDGYQEIMGSGATIEKEPEASNDGDDLVTCHAGVLKGDRSIVATLTITVATRAGGAEIMKCDLDDSCKNTDQDMSMEWESDARPWDKGAIVDDSGSANVEMVWYEGDLTATVTAGVGLDGSSEGEREFVLEQGIAVYDHMAE